MQCSQPGTSGADNTVTEQGRMTRSDQRPMLTDRSGFIWSLPPYQSLLGGRPIASLKALRGDIKIPHSRMTKARWETLVGCLWNESSKSQKRPFV